MAVSAPFWSLLSAVVRLLSRGEIEDGVGQQELCGWLRHPPEGELVQLVRGPLYLRH